MSRVAAGVAAGAALVLLAGVGVVVLQQSDREQPYGEQAAVEAFRSAAATPEPPAAAPPTPAPSADRGPTSVAGPSAQAQAPVAAAPAPAPARTAAPPAAARAAQVQPGVYRYATQGYEEVDALGGARHDYPASTSITYARAGCGSEERWQPLEGRVGVTRLCDGPGGTELRGTYQEREFFGQSEAKSYTCDPGVLLRPRQARPGATWTGRCRSDDSVVDLTTRVVALEELDVDGAAVRVVHLRVAGVLTGATRGRTDREVWLRVEDGLLVQIVGSTDTDADTDVGTVRYREEYRLRLQSLTPRR